MYYAHSANAIGNWHPLAVHLASVAGLAEGFAGKAAWKEEAKLAGLLHDLGKYADRFQQRLHGQDSGLDHWSQGASLALTQFKSIAAALAIQGHHLGLQRGDQDSLRRLLPADLTNGVLPGLALSDADLGRLTGRAKQDALAFEQPGTPAVAGWHQVVAAMLDVRMLFSCLVDADFLDTEAHFNGDANGKRYRAPGPELDADAALAALDRYLSSQIRGTTRAADRVRTARDQLWQAVFDAAQRPPGAFTLTAPTGSGKTLAMLRFALEHARRHGLRRIVLAVPYLTVIEQTARVYRTVFESFPEHFVLEHHSLAGVGEESSRQDAEGDEARQRRLLSENWDAPVILTTNVQLLESLFSNRPSACRKLHRLADSVILFDEAQSLPASLAVPSLAALSRLTEDYGASVVFATATQPAFESLHDAVTKHAVPGWQPEEIVSSPTALFDLMPRRVQYDWRMLSGKTTWPELAAELRTDACRQALVVCNLKRHALTLLEHLQDTEGVFHLSTNLCAAHRRTVLDRVRECLASGQPCRLISTQCVEAGVDIDFPLVFRAFAPLEAIAQAAGRCNREGRLGVPGRVVVFEPDEEGDWKRRYPAFAYYQAAEVARSLLTEQDGLDLDAPETFKRYYRNLYDLSQPAAQAPELNNALNERDFVRTAREYRLIEQNTFQLLVPWADRFDEFAALRDEADRTGITGGWMRRAQMLAVSVYRKADGPPAWAIPAKLKRYRAGGSAVSDEWFILEGDYYDDTLGLMPPEGPQLFIA